jgi:predicted Fe-S protein YdhL (DUF1289 family)
MGFFDLPAPRQAILSPCIGVCNIDSSGLCEGCHRNVDEIAAWGALSDEARLALMLYVLPQREASRAT